jgi:hypothetical protein
VEDDPREVDWAPKRIRGLTRHFEVLEGRVHRLEGQTQFEATEDYDRIKGMEAAVRELQSAVASMRTQQDFMIGEGHGEPFEVWCRRKINGLTHGFEVHTRLIEKTEERLDGLDNADARKGNGIGGLSDQVNSLTETTNRLQELFSRVSALENDSSLPNGTAVSGMDNYMVSPVADDGPKSTWLDRRDANEVEERRRVLVEAMKDRRITFTPGFSDETPLIQAEARVRDYMGNHFSTATVEGVVAALRGGVVRPEDNDSDARLPRNGYARVVATKCPGFGQCYAADQGMHWHDQYGVVHTD